MGTVLLLDTSLSLLQLVDPASGDERTRKDLMQIAVLHFLVRLKSCVCAPPVALYEFSSTCRKVLDFTTDYSAIRRQVYQLSVAEDARLTTALEKIVDDNAYKFPASTRLQVVLFTDGRAVSAWNSTDIQSKTQLQKDSKFQRTDDSEYNPHEELCRFVTLAYSRYRIILHVLRFGGAHEVDSDSIYERLSSLTSGHFESIPLPSSSKVFKQAIDHLCSQHYPSFTGVLSMGELQSPFHLSPDPNACWFDAPGSAGKASMRMGELVNIIGFIKEDNVSTSAPVWSRHSLLPANANGSTTSTNSSCHPLFSLLFQSLRKHAVVALVQLSALSLRFEDSYPTLQWYALLRATPNSLVLDVLEAERGAVQALSDGRESSYALKNRGAFIPSMKQEYVQRELVKLVKYAQALPQRLNALYETCEALRSSAGTFYCPSLLQLIVDTLVDEQRTLSEKDASNASIALLQSLIDGLGRAGIEQRLEFPQQ